MIPKERQDVLDRIKQNELEGGESFFKDVEIDPPSKTLMPNDVDYLKKKLSSKFKYISCRRLVYKMLKKYAVEHEITVNGIENLQNLKGGAVVTSNHFHYFDTAPFVYALKTSKDKRKPYIVIREGNYQLPGVFGYIMKNFTTFPLSSNFQTTRNMNKAIDTVLQKGDLVYVYPEQAMWWKYRKPRQYRSGAYRWAARNDVPILPCFVTMEDMDIEEDDGLKAQKLTLNIMPPIYPDKNLSHKQNAENMMKKNYELCKQKYEEVYGIKLTYTCDENKEECLDQKKTKKIENSKQVKTDLNTQILDEIKEK